MQKLALAGYRLDDYQEMFNLSLSDTPKKILEYACGPSAFNKELHSSIHHVISYDPLYHLDKDILLKKTYLTFEKNACHLRQHKDEFSFTANENLESLVEKRREGLSLFFEDYISGQIENRYVSDLSQLSFISDFYFDIAFTTHYLFDRYTSENISDHLNKIKELCKLAKEVRIFPLIDSQNHPSPLLGPILLNLQQENYGSEVQVVPYHLQSPANAMLRVWAQQCELI